MNFLKPSLIIGLLFSGAVFAVDIPEDDIGSSKYDQMNCVSDYTQNCINDVCLTSEETDCQENCKKLSEEKCQQQLNE